MIYFATYVESAERYVLGEKIEVPLFYVVGCIFCLFLMVWGIRKAKRDKKRSLEKKAKVE